MASGFGAGAGADMLQEILRQRFTEAITKQKLAEEVRQANMANEMQRGNLALANRRTDEDVRQFNEQAPLRGAQTAHLGAETTELQRRPQAEEAQRAFTTSRDEASRTFEGGQNEAQRANAVRITGMNNANAVRIAQMNNALREELGLAKGAPAPQQANEVEDSIALIDQITKDPSLRNAVGPIDQYAGGVVNMDPSGVNRFRALHNQLVGKMSLAQAGKLKGQGQISDKERAMLAAAATALSQGMNEKDYLTELAKVRGQFERMRAPNVSPAGGGAMPAAGGGQEFDYVPGKGLVPRK